MSLRAYDINTTTDTFNHVQIVDKMTVDEVSLDKMAWSPKNFFSFLKERDLVANVINIFLLLSEINSNIL
jgi:hypothetical protein